MCPTDANYRLIRDFDAAIAENRKFRNWGIDFGLAHRFRNAVDVVRFISRLNVFCGPRLAEIKVRAQYGQEHSYVIDKTYLKFIHKIVSGKKNKSTYAQEAMSTTLAMANIFLPDDDSVALSVIDMFSGSFDYYIWKIRNTFYPLSQMYPSFQTGWADNYINDIGPLRERMKAQTVSWDQFSKLGDERSNIDDLIPVTNGGAEINANRLTAADVMDSRPVGIHNVVLRYNETKDVVVLVVMFNPFVVDSQYYRPNFQQAYLSMVLQHDTYSLSQLRILFPWMTEADFETIWNAIE